MFMKHSASFQPAEMIDLAPLGLGRATGAAPAGLLAGSLLETPAGWRPVETLDRTSRVATYDGGFRRVARIDRLRLRPGAAGEVIHVPAGALDNCSALDLLPDQQVFVASSVAEEVLDAAGALVPARALVGHRGIVCLPVLRPLEVTTLGFDDEEIVYVNSGALLHCAMARSDHGRGQVPSGFFEVLAGERAQAMLDLITDGHRLPERLAVAA